jgi:glycine oxidase
VKTFDVAIAGGGLIGASIAFELAAEKLSVIVLDRQQPGREASWAAAGMLSPAPDSPRDNPLVPLSCESLRLYPDFVSAIEETSRMAVSYKRAGAMEVFFAPHGDTQRDRRIADCAALGIAAELIPLAAAREKETSIGPNATAAAWLPEEGTVEPRLLIAAVLEAARSRGVEFRADCAVTGILRDGGRCAGVSAGGEAISAGHVILAAGSFSSQMTSEAEFMARHAPTRPVRGQLIALRSPEVNLTRVLRSERGYLVPRRDGRVVAGSTSEEAGFEKRVTPAGLRRIFDAALELCPELAGAEILETWSGLRPGTPDDLPILGPTEMEGLLIATGHYRNGILLAPVTAKLIREWVTTGRTSFNATAFFPLRFSGGKTQVQSAR